MAPRRGIDVRIFWEWLLSGDGMGWDGRLIGGWMNLDLDAWEGILEG